MNNELEQLGLSQHEATVYLALLDLGSVGAGNLIRKTGLHRNIIYETLNKLIAKHLATQFTQKKVAQYRATDPSQLIDSLKTKTEIAQQLIPELKQRSTIHQEITLFEGLDGFRTFSLEFISKMQEEDTYYVLGAVGDLWWELMGPTSKRFEAIRLKKKVAIKMVSYQTSEIDQNHAHQSQRFEVKIVPQGINIPANTLIWNDRIALQTLVEPYSVIEIRNPILAKAYLTQFTALWNQGGKT